MAEITIDRTSSEFVEDTMIQSVAPTTNSVNSTSLTFGNNSGFIYNIIIQIDLSRRPRFIPYLGSAPSGGTADNGYTSESAYASRTQLAALAGEFGVFLIDRTLDLQDLGGVTYAKVSQSPSVSWTTAGGMDDVEYGITDCDFSPSGANLDYDIPIGARLIRHAMFNKTNILVHSESGLITFFASQENSNNHGIKLRGRFTTRNRENPIRSRKFGVR